jgi:hypothetical protein
MRESVKIKIKLGFATIGEKRQWLKMTEKENLFLTVEYHLQKLGFAYNLTSLDFDKHYVRSGESIYIDLVNCLGGDPFGGQEVKPKMELIKAEELRELASFVGYAITSCKCCQGAEIYEESERLLRALKNLDGQNSRSKQANKKAKDYMRYGKSCLVEVIARMAGSAGSREAK